MATGFKVITLKPQKVGNIGKVDAGVDVTEQLGAFRHLQSLVDMGDVMLVPVSDEFPVAATSAKSEASAVSPAAEAEQPSGSAAEPDGMEQSASNTIDYMDDPAGFSISEVMSYADAHPEHAAMLLDMEAEGKNRNRLVKHLSGLLGKA